VSARVRLAALLGVAIATTGASGAGVDLGTDAQRAAGKKTYEKFCSGCHGDAGDGAGLAAVHLLPLPRNFTTGKFKVRTTPSGALPTTDDIKRVIRRGMPYSSMPAWANFTDEELTGLAYYVKSFSPDFAKTEFNVAPVSLPSAPKYTKESAEKGRKVYEDTGCISCHGDLGRGDGTSAPTLLDDLGHPIRPADFTQRWTFRGGPTREDIFRTMTTGLNGTPMPAFGDALKPEERWAITDYIVSLGDGDDPRYASLLVARHVDDAIDLAKADAAFATARTARFPIVGQIMEPGREFHPPVPSIRADAVYDADSIAVRLRWNDVSAETAGKNSPALPVPKAEEDVPAGAPAEAPKKDEGDVWGGQEEKPKATPAPAKPSEDAWGESASAAPAAAAGSEFSDAVAVQFPLVNPSGARKPYFLLGDAANPVDLWFVDLARGKAEQYVGKGSADVTPSDADDVTATAHYEKGEWTVVLKRPLRVASGPAFAPGQFVPIAFSVWDGHSRERGNKRGLTLWFSLYVEPEHVPSATGPMIQAALLALLVEIAIVAFVRRKRSHPAPSGAGRSLPSSVPQS
jgi:mono/diheme cytochrome c family protein